MSDQQADLSIAQNWFDTKTLLLCYHMHRVYGANKERIGKEIKACAWKLRKTTKDPMFFDLVDSLSRTHWAKANHCIERMNSKLKTEFIKDAA
ncbi:hypothetical protein [Paraglaciecola sp.]|uniref:hypothetical protein n=1 Tax=Paraglaciecola sp. TaxID=1920173 RepID=UPI003EF9E1B7